MNALVQNLRNTHRALFVLVLTTLAITAAPSLLQRSQAGDGDAAGKPQAVRTPKIREVVEVPEEYVGKEFTYTVRISTNSHWMRRAGPISSSSCRMPRAPKCLELDSRQIPL